MTLNHQDHVNLLKNGIPLPGGIWADLGSGGGAFTLALAELVGAQGVIYSVDRDQAALRRQGRSLQKRYQDVAVHFRKGDFTHPLELPPLDGIVMANSLHFVRDKEPVIQLVKSYLKPQGRFILVEYNVDRGNIWVPHPLSYPTWEKLAASWGFKNTRLIASRPSRFLGEIFSAVSEI